MFDDDGSIMHDYVDDDSIYDDMVVLGCMTMMIGIKLPLVQSRIALIQINERMSSIKTINRVWFNYYVTLIM